jgi:pimeloyl-ACP methyl ester carboxylesterase
VGLYAEVAGEGPEIVLSHEGLCDSRMWDPQWESFTRSHRVLRFDFRGYGRTPLSPGRYSAAQDVIDLLDEHGLERAAFVGVSLGGRVALEVALAQPERVSALVLVGSGLPGHDWSDETGRTMAANLYTMAKALAADKDAAPEI